MRTRQKEPTIPVVTSAVQCSPDVLRRVLAGTAFFASLTESEIDGIAGSFRQTHYEHGSVIQHAGDLADRLSIVAAGHVRVIRSTRDGHDVVLDLLHTGDFFGSLAVLGTDHVTEDVYAHTFCCVLHTTPAAFQRLLETYPSAAMATLAFVADRLQTARTTIEQLSAYPVEQRLTRMLLNLADRAGVTREDDILIDVPLSRQDLADMTGAKVETISRIVSSLRREGILNSGRGWIAVADRDALEAVAEG